MTPASESRVFISYARKDGSKLALRLQKDLAKEGLYVWLDTQSIRGGEIWTAEIERAIDDCATVLAVLTPEYFRSPTCRAEQERSLRKGKSVIPLLARRGSDVPLLLEMKQYRDFTAAANYKAQFRLLIEDLRNVKKVVPLRGQLRKTPVIGTVPPLPNNYVERQDALPHLRETILGDGPGPSIALIAMRGMGGIGKTVLAQALCRDEIVQQAFPDGILWATVGKHAAYDLVTSMRALRRGLGDEPDEDESELECIQRYRALICEKAALVIVDDVWRTEDIEPFFVDSPRSRLLFTTRNSDIANTTGAIEVVAELLNLDQSRAMLARYADLAVDELPSVADDLIDECGHLPLALSMIGAMLRAKQDNYWPRVLALLHAADLAKIKGDFMNYPHKDLLRSIQVSVDALDEIVRHRYFALAVLLDKMPAPPAIQRALWNTDEFGALDTAEQLVSLSLAQRDASGTGIVVHDLQLDYVRAHYPDRVALDLIHGAARLSASVIQKDPSQFASQMIGRLLPRRELPAIDQLILTITRGASSPWLRPILPALDPPGAPLFPPREGHYSGVSGVALTNDGRRVISASLDETVKVWDLETGRELHTLKGHSSAVYGVAVTADGKRAVSASGDKTLRVWDLETGRELRTLEGHSRGVINVVVSPDGRRAISASWDATLKIWDLESGVEVKTLKGHSKSLNSVAVSADWRLAISASEDTTLKVWNLVTGREVRTLEGHSADVWGVALSADGRVAVSVSEDKTLKVWNVKTGRERYTFRGHTSAVYGIAVSIDGRLAVSASDDGTLKVWDLEAGHELRTLRGHSTMVYGVALSTDCRLAVSASYDATLKVWDLATGRELRTLEGRSDALNAVSVSADGGLAVFASDDKTVKLWDLRAERELRTLSGHASPVYDVAISGDGRRAISASDDDTLKVWDLPTGRQIRTLQGHRSSVNGVAVSADWRLAVSSCYDNTLKVWDLETGSEIRTLRGHKSSVFGVAVSADGTRAVSASYDATLKIWDVGSGRTLHTLKKHSEPVNCVTLTVDGRQAFSGSDDCTIKMWDVETGREVRTIEGHTDSVSYLAVSPNGAWLASASWDKTLKVWDIKTGALLTAFTCDAPALCCGFAQDEKVAAGDHLGRIHLFSLDLSKTT
jgi:WD40 repeat protein